MKRNTFLRNLLASVALLTNALPVIAHRNGVRPGKGFFIQGGKDRHDVPFQLSAGEAFFTKISTADTDGDLYIAEFSRVKKGGPPLHFHPQQDEWFYVLEGEFDFTMGDQNFRAKVGDSIFIPRNTHHAFSKANAENEKARMLISYQPAGKMESYFKGLAQGVFKTLGEADWVKFQIEHGVVPVSETIH